MAGIFISSLIVSSFFQHMVVGISVILGGMRGHWEELAAGCNTDHATNLLCPTACELLESFAPVVTEDTLPPHHFVLLWIDHWETQ